MRSITTLPTRFRELSELPPGMYRGQLAEDYDGIGQYVAVALSRGSVSSAYKARVAAGDFGGGRTLPVGTPVVVSVTHGNVEVFLGNQPRGCTIVFPEDHAPGGWGPVFGVPTEPDNPNWLTEACDPGDAWYFQSNPLLYSVSDGVGIIDLTDDATVHLPTNSNPWIFYRLGDPTEEIAVGDDALDFKVKLQVNIPDLVDPDTMSPQIDFYICTDDRLGDIGTVGDAYYLTLDSYAPGGSGLGQPRYPRLRVGFFSNIGMGYPAITDFPDSPYVEWKADFDYGIWNTDIFVRLRIERNGSLADIMGKVWPADDDEPEDFQALWGKIDDTNWRGARMFIVGPYDALRILVSGFVFAPMSYYIYYIQDLSKKICAGSDDRELDPCN